MQAASPSADRSELAQATTVRSTEESSVIILRRANLIQLGIAIVLFFTAGISAASAWSAQHAARLLAADATWERYQELASAFPELESDHVNFHDSGNAEDSHYAWFVERGLFAGDQIMEAEPDDPQWQDAITWEILRHRRYVVSNMFPAGRPQVMSSFCTYRAPLRNLIIRALQSDTYASRRLNVAERLCRAALTARGYPDA